MSTKFLIQEPPLIVQPTLVKMLKGNLNKAILVQQLHWLMQSSRSFEREGRRWVRMPARGWQEMMPWLHLKTVERLLAELEKEGLFHTREFNEHNTDRTNSYTLVYDALNTLFQQNFAICEENVTPERDLGNEVPHPRGTGLHTPAKRGSLYKENKAIKREHLAGEVPQGEQKAPEPIELAAEGQDETSLFERINANRIAAGRRPCKAVWHSLEQRNAYHKAREHFGKRFAEQVDAAFATGKSDIDAIVNSLNARRKMDGDSPYKSVNASGSMDDKALQSAFSNPFSVVGSGRVKKDATAESR